MEGPPAERVGDEARQRPRQEDAQHQAAHHVADDLAAPLGRRHGRSERHQDLDHRTGRADEHEGQDEQAGAGREAGKDGKNDGGREHAQHQAPVLREVGERHQKEQAAGITDQGRHGDEPRGRFAEAEIGGDQADERLRREYIGDDDRHRAGEQQSQGRAQCGRGLRRAGEVGRGRSNGGHEGSGKGICI